MRAKSVYFTNPFELEIRESPIPEPGPDQVRVTAEFSAISSGTELLVYRGEISPNLPIDIAIKTLEGSFSFPLQYGYSVVGRVTATGKNIDEHWLDTRVFAFHPHASHFITSLDDIVPLPENCSSEAATLLANLEAATNFVLDGMPHLGERILVLGQGTVGLLTTTILSTFPLDELITADLYDHRRAVSTEFGADVSLDPSTTDIADHVNNRQQSGADATFELSGNPDALETAINATGYAGRIIMGSWYGTKPVTVTFDGRFHRSRIRMISSQVSTIDPRLQGRWTRERRLTVARNWLPQIDTDGLITHQFPITQAADAYELLNNHPEDALQVILTY